MFYFFFFQAEDGIRDVAVTGVQTCALPIWPEPSPEARGRAWREFERRYLDVGPETTGDGRETDGTRPALPPTADRALMAATFAYLYGLGATLVLLSVVLPHPPYRSLAGVLISVLLGYG